jgi:hypothetical protein
MVRLLKAGLAVSLLSIIMWNCSSTEPVNPVDAQNPPVSTEASLITLTEQSGENPSLLQMGPPVYPATPSSASSGTWMETADSLGMTVKFIGAAPTASAPGTSTELLFSVADMKSSSVVPVPGVALDAGTGTTPPQAGLLTAAEWNDHCHWHDFQVYVRENPSAFTRWQLNLQKRIMIEIKNRSGGVVPGAMVQISAAGKTVFEGQTLADGRTAFFPLDVRADDTAGYNITVQKGTATVTAEMKPVQDNDQTWTLTLPVCSHSVTPSLDLVFVVDVTGSMSDELSFIQTELVDICGQVYSAGIAGLRVGFVFYRDRGDEFVTRVLEFSSDFEKAQQNINSVQATGGGDKEESVNLAMRHMLQKLAWHTENCVRLCFWITDAGPHYYADEDYTYHEGLIEAVKKGIKINPVAASGILPEEEYFYRNAAVKTLGRYLFLTDNSGVGDAHLTPAVGSFDVKLLNALIVKVIKEELGKWPAGQ